MSLYDGLGLDIKDKGPKEQKADLTGWSSGIKLLQSQLQLKKAALTQAKRTDQKGTVLAPVVDLKSRKDEQEETPPLPAIGLSQGRETKSAVTATLLGGDWDIRLEYDPMWPNDYEKIMKDRMEKKQKERQELRESDIRERRQKDRVRDRDIDKRREQEEEKELPKKASTNTGAAIAPPPSLLEPTDKKEELPSNVKYSGGLGGSVSSVAARIMAKYGYKEGQGLGKKEQGMSQALLVEKTSKRGGKIIHEKDLPKEPQVSSPSTGSGSSASESITEMMKNPSKVVLLRNMVGPGEVDEDLEPETKEECGKYGDVIRCLIFEIPGGNVPDEEAVRIFIEFKRMESAIKAVVDLNGRYFGGRVVKASFYDQDKFKRFELAD
ncbi:splicing factor 45 [Tachypleus tridentatus]|uniref:splicing factor 45 n=1 Tax=Tachypleus tridentatus TaxID=6853 RepID=UPI003FD0157C